MSRASSEQARLRRRLAMKARHGDARLVYRHEAEVRLLFDEERVRSWGLVGAH